ncbi:hypothetical protein KPH14_004029 [Odynerus spinipes]|uniref:C-type lectin domain-containing protein n=1 Tax=Odynerus spinipes TaxID=1348599 RepID=A0AAD9VVR9_9HYME|nr:hypothetical protein KPH14_004029 [Odynerus spinipes]
MLKFLLIAFCIIHAARSNMREPTFRDFEIPLPFNMENNSGSSNCSFSGQRNPPPSLPDVQSFLPSSFVLKCNFVAKKLARDDYHHVPGIGFYKFHTRATTWNEARKICNEEGGHLAIINSAAEMRVLVDLLLHASPIKGAVNQIQAFVGVHDLYAEGDWVSIHGDSLAKTGYSEWTDMWGGQPDNGGGIQNCGTLVEDGKLDDVSCQAIYAFFCEIPL